MVESSLSPTRSFSQPSPASADEKKRNPLRHALTTSVSFGRFVSESLDWEKWSAFTHNRYMEDVEKYSKPGSVAEKKAYFEAHFKRRRAAALLEQKNESTNNISVNSTDMKINNNFPSDLQNTKHEEVHNNIPVFPVDQNYSNNLSYESNTTEEGLPEGGNEKISEQSVPPEMPLEITKHLKNAECNGDILSKEDDNVCDEVDDFSKKNSASLSGKNYEVSSSNPSTNSSGVSTSALSIKKTMHPQTRTHVKIPDMNKVMESSNKRRSYTTSLHMSINFGSCSQKATSLGAPKITEKPVLIRAPTKKYKNNTTAALTRASVGGIFKHISAENRRSVIAQGTSTSVRRTVDFIVQPSSSKIFKPSNISEGKAQLRTVSSPFKFKSEERVAKRKEFFEKLEEKRKLKEAEKQKHDQLKSQINTRSNSKDLSNSTASKAVETTEPSARTKLPPRYSKKKAPNERLPSCFPKVEETASPNDSRRLNSVAGKNPSGKSLSKKTNENVSPNIQRVVT